MQKNGEKPYVSDDDVEILQKVLKLDGFENLTKPNKTLVNIIITLCCIFTVTIALGIFFTNKIIRDMYREYVRNTEDIIRAKSDIDYANSWERLPPNQRRKD